MNTNATDQHRTSEPSLEEMTHIMNFEDGNGKTPEQPDNENNVIDVEAIEDFTPEKNATKVKFSKNGMSKGTLVGAAGLVALVGGLTFFQGQMPKDKVAEAPKPKDPASEQLETAQSDVTKAQQSESEIKSELALSKQKDALEQANSSKSSDPTTGTPTDKTTDPNTKVAASPAPSVPVVPPVRPSRASGFVAAPVVPPLAIPPSGSTKIASAPFVPPAKNNISVPPTGVQPRTLVSTPKFATTSTGALNSKNISPSPVGIALPIAAAPGVPKAPKPTEVAKIEPVRSAPVAIAKIEPTRSSPTRATRKQFSEDSEEPLTRLPIARAPGTTTEIASSNLPAPPLYPPVVSQPSTSSIPPVAISSSPSLTDFLRTSSAADTPPAPQPQLIALNKEQSKDKQLVTTKDPKSILQTVPTPVDLTATKSKLIASNKDKHSGLISPNSPLIDIADPAPFGITNPVASAGNVATQTVAKPALAQAVPPGTSSTRPAYAHTKMLLAGLPDSNMNLGNVEATNQPNLAPQNSQVNKSQVVSQSNPILNQPASTTVPGTPISPVSPTTPIPASISPIAASILTGTSAKGTTLTPILWGSDSANGAKFVAKLEEPLLANNKREALPAGTQLVVMARPSANGNSNNNSSSLVEVDVVAVIVQGREYATPPGAIVIHDENNGLLVGEDYFKREDQIASRDYLTVLGGALNTLGQVLNRPSGTFSSNTSGFGSSSTNVVNNRDPNIFGALLEGGFKDIPGIWSQRNQQALAQLANQPKVYQIPKGRTIRVFVNQSIVF